MHHVVFFHFSSFPFSLKNPLEIVPPVMLQSAGLDIGQLPLQFINNINDNKSRRNKRGKIAF
jgi:hypothetical protein